VKEVTVSATDKAATVQYDQTGVMPPQLVNCVNQAGFKASLPGSG
jgi:copper chaperone CopZ